MVKVALELDSVDLSLKQKEKTHEVVHTCGRLYVLLL